MCEQLGREPDPKKMPLTDADFPVEVQVAFFIYSYMPDHWDGASGAYFGKDWSALEALFNIFEAEDKVFTLQLLKIIDVTTTDSVNAKIAQKRKASELAAKAKAAAK